MTKREDVALKFLHLFEGLSGAHGTHGEPQQKADSLKWEIKSTAQTLREPVTVDLWRRHLAGKRPLGITAIREDGLVRWGCVDYDVYDANLLKLVADVERAKLPLVPCRSKSGGLHLFLFMQDWTSAVNVQLALRDIAAQIGMARSEIFPKQTQILVERGDFGSWMVMPYFGDTFGGKLQNQVGLRKSGGEMTPQEFIALAEDRAVDEGALSKLARKRPARPTSRAESDPADTVEYPEPDEPFGDGPCCLQTLARNKVRAGSQNNALLNMGIYFKMRDPDGWQQRLERAAQDYLLPPGKAEATTETIKSLEKRDYHYTCKTQPICDFCNPALCRTRPFGVGDEGAFPTLDGMTVLMTDPPIWFVEVGGERIELTTEQLQNYQLFQRVCMGKKVMYMPMSQKDWTIALKDGIERAQPLPAPEDAGNRGMFKELLEEFCTNRNRAMTKEEIPLGRPWLDENDQHHYFRIRDLQRFLLREGVKDMGRNVIAQRITDMGGGSHFFNVKGRGVRCWRVPDAALEHTPETDAPKTEEPEV